MKRLTILITLLLISLFGIAQDGSIIGSYQLNSDNEQLIKDPATVRSWSAGMTNIGDLDKDGVDDLAVGAIDYDPIDGVLAILFMNADGTIKSRTLIGEGIGGLTTDIPNDFGSFGQGVTSLGDFDGDGIIDIAVGNWGTNFGGEVFLLFLNTDGTVKSHKRIAAGVNGFNHALDNDEAFGSTVANIGDLDGNGVTDILVGSKNKDNGGTGRGSVYVIFLNEDASVKEYQEISSTEGNFDEPLADYSRFGLSLIAYAPSKVMIGTGTNVLGSSGGVWFLELNQDGTVKNKNQIAENKGGFSEMLNPGSDFGFSLSLVGDINDDGIMDIMVGAPYYDDGGDETGAAFLLFMNNDGTVKDHIKYSNSTLPYSLNTDDNFGFSLAGMGDWNGDGKYDIAVGTKERYEGKVKGAVHLLFLDGKDQKVGVNNISLTNINVYPNPANKSIKIDNTNLTNANYTVTIFDVTGRQVLLKNSTAIKQQEINIETLQEGVYHILITTYDNRSYQSKLVVQH